MLPFKYNILSYSLSIHIWTQYILVIFTLYSLPLILQAPLPTLHTLFCSFLKNIPVHDISAAHMHKGDRPAMAVS